MSALEDILHPTKYAATPAALAAKFRAGGTGNVAELFGRFVGYASANWQYNATVGPIQAAQILAGSGPRTLACGTIREVFKEMMRGQGHTVTNASKDSYFLTKPGLQCFDPRVVGNVEDHKGATVGLACHFSSHYFVSINGRFYDPCLMAVYQDQEGPVAAETVAIGEGLRIAGTGRQLIVLSSLMRAVPGFASVWEILTPKACAKVLKADKLAALKCHPTVKASGFF